MVTIMDNSKQQNVTKFVKNQVLEEDEPMLGSDFVWTTPAWDPSLHFWIGGDSLANWT